MSQDEKQSLLGVAKSRLDQVLEEAVKLKIYIAGLEGKELGDLLVPCMPDNHKSSITENNKCTEITLKKTGNHSVDNVREILKQQNGKGLHISKIMELLENNDPKAKFSVQSTLNKYSRKNIGGIKKIAPGTFALK